MKVVYRTPNAFFVSPIGKRLQKQIGVFFEKESLRGVPAVLIGPVFPFLAVFDQNNPDIVFETEACAENDFFSALPPPFSVEAVFIAALIDSVLNNCSLLFIVPSLVFHSWTLVTLVFLLILFHYNSLDCIFF